MSSSQNPQTEPASDGMTQGQVASLQQMADVLIGKMTAFSDRLSLYEESVRRRGDGPVSGISGLGWS